MNETFHTKQKNADELGMGEKTIRNRHRERVCVSVLLFGYLPNGAYLTPEWFADICWRLIRLKQDPQAG